MENVRGVHLVGSVPLDSATDVFECASTTLGKHVKRIPDGEPQERRQFTFFQRGIFKSCPEVIRATLGPMEPNEYESDEYRRILSTVPEYLATTYDDHALASYAHFSKLQSRGIIEPDVKFQVCLPTPTNVMVLLEEQFRADVEVIYERSLFATVRRIQEEIPHEKLAIQWDVAVDLSLIEGKWYFGDVLKPWYHPVREGVIERLSACVSQVDDDVEVGIHLCYGDMGHAHFVEPKDLALLVDLANEVSRQMSRPLDWLHVPVPKNRDDAAYFTPLKDLDLHGGKTELYLGLVHANDEEGTKRRIKTAAQVVTSFGVGTECGMGRTPKEQVIPILKMSADVTKPWA